MNSANVLPNFVAVAAALQEHLGHRGTEYQYPIREVTLMREDDMLAFNDGQTSFLEFQPIPEDDAERPWGNLGGSIGKGKQGLVFSATIPIPDSGGAQTVAAVKVTPIHDRFLLERILEQYQNRSYVRQWRDGRISICSMFQQYYKETNDQNAKRECGKDRNVWNVDAYVEAINHWLMSCCVFLGLSPNYPMLYGTYRAVQGIVPVQVNVAEYIVGPTLANWVRTVLHRESDLVTRQQFMRASVVLKKGLTAVFLQLAHALWVGRFVQFIHYDLHGNNVMLDIDDAVERNIHRLVYQFRDQMFAVSLFLDAEQTIPIGIAKIIDFGFSSSVLHAIRGSEEDETTEVVEVRSKIPIPCTGTTSARNCDFAFPYGIFRIVYAILYHAKGPYGERWKNDRQQFDNAALLLCGPLVEILEGFDLYACYHEHDVVKQARRVQRWALDHPNSAEDFMTRYGTPITQEELEPNEYVWANADALAQIQNASTVGNEPGTGHLNKARIFATNPRVLSEHL